MPTCSACKSTGNGRRRSGTRIAVKSDRQVRANRRNARKSTGPKTAKGKQTVSSNALKHGLTAQILQAAPDARACALAALAVRAPALTDERRLWAEAHSALK